MVQKSKVIGKKKKKVNVVFAILICLAFVVAGNDLGQVTSLSLITGTGGNKYIEVGHSHYDLSSTGGFIACGADWWGPVYILWTDNDVINALNWSNCMQSMKSATPILKFIPLTGTSSTAVMGAGNYRPVVYTYSIVKQ
ncbi:MAG: hypothetical protein JW915_24615 [Chitinispirillaceae bacterium]|nr:hypothetical protein [Chitinispirillaceae bacterium]